MDIGVVMLVKNEVQRLEGALAPILDQLAQIVVLDNGSTDGTQDLLRERLGIEPIDAGRDAGTFFSKSVLRNQGLGMLHTDWCLSLDADERLDPRGLDALRKNPPPDGVAGLFLCWRNFLEHGETFDDYKCAVFRRGVTMSHIEHENAQTAVRRAGEIVEWTDAVILEHHPEGCKDAWKRQFYRQRLAYAIQQEPDVPRYPWFAGYAAYHQQQYDEASVWLNRAAESTHPLYPVERLNSRVVLASMAARQQDFDVSRHHVGLARRLFHEVRDDFEVRINHWIQPWLEDAEEKLANGRADAISAPRFAH
ncbi:MAG: glycosyltransferase family 2 protein [Sedimenticolaceae bacterium]